MVVLVGLLQGSLAWADQVTLTNGDRLTGRIVELNAENLRLQTELFGEVSIPRRAVASLSSDQALAVTLPDDHVVVGTVASRDGQVVVRNEQGEASVGLADLRALRTPEAQADYERSIYPRWYQNWQTGVNIAFSSRGRGGTTRLATGIDAARRTSNDEFSFFYKSLQEVEKSGAVVNDDKVRAGALYARKLSRHLYYFAMADFDYDALQHLSLRSVLGSGVGWRLKETHRVSFDVLGGGAFNQEYFQNEPARRSAEALVGEELRWRIAPRTYFEERALLFPNVSRPGEYRVLFTTALETRINSWLSWYLDFTNHRLSDPPPDTKKNDMLLTTGLRLSFGRDRQGLRLQSVARKP